MSTPSLPQTLPAPSAPVQTRPSPSTGDGDHERFAHYVPKDKIVESAVTGEPVQALCGKTWVPSRDPERFPVCPTCAEIYAAKIIAETGD